jgi:hypothetical protein
LPIEDWSLPRSLHFIITALGVGAVLLWLATTISNTFRSEEGYIRFAVHAEMSDGDTPYKGTGVWELHVQQVPLGSSMGLRVRGEAIRLQGPGYRNLFLLRKGVGPNSGPTGGGYPILCGDGTSRTNFEFIAKLRDQFIGPCEIDAHPMLVEAANPLDPATIKPLVYTQQQKGPCDGLCLRKLWIERTDEPVTTGVKYVFPWLEGLEFSASEIVTGKKIFALAPDSKILMRMDFSTEVTGRDSYE